MLDPKNLKNGEEQHEEFTLRAVKGKRVQYDYRSFDGELFSCVKKTLTECRNARDTWVFSRQNKGVQSK